MHILTLIAPSNVAPLADNSRILAVVRAMVNPVRIVRLSPYAVDLLLEYAPTQAVGNQLFGLTREAGIDAVIQPTEHREKQLFISDMDSTMIQQECIDELADRVGLRAHVAAITERAMNGELDFKEALRARVALLKGLPEVALGEVFAERIRLMPGARTLIGTLRARGVYTVLVSGGFDFFTSRVAHALGFHAEEANQLEVVDGKLTGKVVEPILDKNAKLNALQFIAEKRRIPLAATMAVGDGANDLPMMLASGLGVAYRAKPMVEARAAAAIRFGDLSALLYVLGVPQNEWVAA